MARMTASEAKQNFGKVITKSQRGPVAITKHGEEIAVVISAEQYEAEQEQKKFQMFTMLNQGLDDIEAGRTQSLEDVKADIFKHLNDDAA